MSQSQQELPDGEDSYQKKNTKVIETEIDEVMELQNEGDEDSSENVEEAYLEPQDQVQNQDEE